NEKETRHVLDLLLLDEILGCVFTTVDQGRTSSRPPCLHPALTTHFILHVPLSPVLVSALRDQASLLGMPIGILAAKTAASNLEKISADSGQVALLNAEQRNKLSCLLQTLKDLLTRNAFCRLLFAQEIWKMQVRGRGLRFTALGATRPGSVSLRASAPDWPQLGYGGHFSLPLGDAGDRRPSGAATAPGPAGDAQERSVQLLSPQLPSALSAEDLIRQLQQVLETSEVNWRHVLSCVSTLLICHAEAEPLVKDLLGRLLTKAFENYDLESMITAFLIVRQAALEGPAVFVPYSEWFKAAFGSAGGLHSSSKKASVFFFKFLSDLVPFEAPQYLKVHILHPPLVPSKYRPFLLEYVTLAKTRLADLKVSIEDMGLYEDLSSTKEAVQPQSQALQDAEKAVQIFETTRKIPVSVMEARYGVLTAVPQRMLFPWAEKIPPNMFARYVEECRALKEKLLPGEGCVQPPPRQSPARLPDCLAGLAAHPAGRHTALSCWSFCPLSPAAGVPAQIAVISEKLSRVLGSAAEGEEAASPGPRMKLDLSAPEVERQHQEVVDLLLSSFCQNVIAASYFLPPERQGAWPSRLVRTICGFRRLLPSLLGRLCQLLCHQSRSLNEAQVVGLATLAVHLNEARALIPEVDLCASSAPCSASVRGLSVPELWDHLLVCRTGESAVFCMRFCTAALAYFLCKFSSLSHDERCRLLHPGFVKKLQYLVPRFHLEARGHGFGDGLVELPWETFCQPTPCSREAALRLWKQTHFRELLWESAFQLTLQEWLLMELGVHPDGDVLSACERYEFQHWALHQHFLPAPAAARGCDGDLSEMCAVLLGLSLSQRLDGLPSWLQEMLLELERRRAPLDSCESRGHFPFCVFRERLNALGTGSAVGERLPWQQELLLQRQALLSLPPAVLVAARHRGRSTSLDCEDFFSFVNTELKNVSSRGYALSYDITAHFFRGLLGASLECEDPAREVTAVLALCQARSPVILYGLLAPLEVFRDPSAASGLPLSRPSRCSRSSLLPVLAPPPSFLSSEASFPRSDIPWISAAFLHFTIQQQAGQERPEGLLKRLGAGAEQPERCPLPRLCRLQEGLDARKSLAWSSEVLRHLGDRGVSWLALFSSAEEGADSPHRILRSAVSEQHLRLLPWAFYSVLLTVEAERLPREPAFLAVAVDMYAQLLQLFVDGDTAEGRLPASAPVSPRGRVGPALSHWHPHRLLPALAARSAGDRDARSPCRGPAVGKCVRARWQGDRGRALAEGPLRRRLRLPASSRARLVFQTKRPRRPFSKASKGFEYLAGGAGAPSFTSFTRPGSCVANGAG
uniref:FA complementation group A n=1 Tax=Varanus komodoensis TaxID=61221 RepID=A0A8D2J4R4_VARKO